MSTEVFQTDSRVEAKSLPNMVLMLLGKLVSLLGSYIYSFVMGLYVLKVTGSAMSFAATLVFGTLPRIILAPFAGALADRFDRKKMVVGMDLVCGAVLLLLYGISSSYGLRIPFIYGAAFLLALANTFLNVALDAAIPNLVSDRHLVRINSLSQSIVSLTQIIAPFAGGLVYGLVDTRIFVLIAGGSFIASAISEAFIDFRLNAPPAAEGEARTESIFVQMREGFRFLRQNSILLTIGLFAVFLNFFAGLGFGVAIPYIINNVLEMDPSLYGIISAFMPAGILISSILLSMLPEFRRRYRAIFLGLLAMAVALMASGLPAAPVLMDLGHGPIFVFYLILMLASGLANPFVNIPLFVMMQRQTPDNYRGRVFGLVQTMCMAITPVAYLLAGAITERVPPWSVPLGSGLAMLMVVLLLAGNKEIQAI
ncbi:MAG: MFS transporter [Bacillota bacterium]